MRRGFTIVELLVAIGILVALLTASGVIFSMAVDAQRAASATSEITEKLQAMRDQLDYDFSHLDKTGPLAIWFEVNPVYEASGAVDRYERFDQILFFCVGGNFDTTRQYDDNPDPLVDNLVTVTGNSARVYYGHADRIDYANRIPGDKGLVEGYQFFRTLARRQHVLTSQTVEPFPNFLDFVGYADFSGAFLTIYNDLYEYDTLPLNVWGNIFNYIDPVDGPDNAEHIIWTCFDKVEGRSGIDLGEPLTLHMLMCQGVGSFKIQLAYDVNGQLLWLPNTDTAADVLDFVVIQNDSFGIYTNMPGGIDVDTTGDSVNDWAVQPSGRYDIDGDTNLDTLLEPLGALKFTFTLYDSNGVFAEGKTFTHIVYLD
jgi:prepilin-type N-terminal cleavage/methylation domain-containing protein